MATQQIRSKKPPPPPPPGSVERFLAKSKKKTEEPKPAVVPAGIPTLQFGIPRTSVLTGDPYMEPYSPVPPPQQISQKKSNIEIQAENAARSVKAPFETFDKGLREAANGSPLSGFLNIGKSFLELPGILFGPAEAAVRTVEGKDLLSFAEQAQNAPALPGYAGIAQKAFGLLNSLPGGIKRGIGSISGGALADAANAPFEMLDEGVSAGTNLIDQGLSKVGIDKNFEEESLRSMGITDETIANLRASGKTLDEINHILVQYAAFEAGAKGARGTARGIVNMQKEAARLPTVTQSPDASFIPIRRRQGFNQTPEGVGIPGDMATLPAIREGGMVPPTPEFTRQGEIIQGVRDAGLPRQVKGLLPEKSIAPRRPSQEPIRTFEVGPDGVAVQTKSKPAPPAPRRTHSPTVTEMGTFPQVRQSVVDHGMTPNMRFEMEKKIGPEAKKMTDVQIIDEMNRLDLWPRTALNELGREQLYDLVRRGWITLEEAKANLAKNADGSFTLKGDVNKGMAEDIRRQDAKLKAKEKAKKGGKKTAAKTGEPPAGKAETEPMFKGDTAESILDEAMDDRSHGSEELAAASKSVWDELEGQGYDFKKKLTEEERVALSDKIEKRAKIILDAGDAQGGTNPKSPKINRDPTQPVEPADDLLNTPSGDKAKWQDGAEPIAATDGEAVSFLGADANLENARAVVISEPGGRYSIADRDGNPLLDDRLQKQIFENVEDAKRAAEIEYKPESKVFERSERVATFEVPLSDIKIKTGKEFQERPTMYARKSVDSIKQDFYDGVWRFESMDPIHLWEDPVTKELYTINHSRRQAFQELFDEGNTQFGTVPSIILRDISFKEAIDIANKSNRTNTPPGPLTRSKLYRDMREQGESKKSIEKKAMQLEGKGNYRGIINISHLNPRGKIAELIDRMTEDGGDMISNDLANLNTMAEWIGDLRRRYPKLTNTHENEIFQYLLENYGGNGVGIKSRPQFHEAVESAIEKQSGGKLKFKVDEPINVGNGVHRSPAEIEYQKQIDDVNLQLREKSKEIKRENDKLHRLKKTDVERRNDPKMKKLYEEQTELNRKLNDLTSKAADNVGVIRASEMSLFDKPPETYSAAFKEAVRRLKEKGLIDPNILRMGLPIDPQNVRYILNPILEKAWFDAKELLDRGMLKNEDVARWMRNKADELIAADPEFRKLDGKQKAMFARELRKEMDRWKYNPISATFKNEERQEFDKAILESMGDVVTQELESSPRSETTTRPNPRHRDNMKSLTGTMLHTAGTFISKQGKPDKNGVTPGQKIFDKINNVDRQAAQEAGRDERLIRIATKDLTKQEYKEFTLIADGKNGGKSSNPKIQRAVDEWSKGSDRVYDAAKAVDLQEMIPMTEELLDGSTRHTFKMVPIRKVEFYFPREYDIKKLNDPAFQHTQVERLAEKNGISHAEAQELINEWMKWKFEEKYGHLERPRSFDMEGWSQERDVIPSYYEKAWKRIKMREHLGEEYQDIHTLIEQIAQDGGDWESANIFFDRWAGRERFTDPVLRSFKSLATLTGSWQVATKLQLLSLLNWTQLGNAGLYTGMWGLTKGTLKAAGNWKEAVKFAEESGAIIENTITMHMKESLSVDGMGGKVMRYTGVTKQEGLLRTFASNVISSWAAGEVPKLSKPKEFARMQRFLGDMNLSRQIDLNAVKKRGHFTENELSDIGYEGARATQFLTRTQDVPFLISHPAGKMFTQFKAFATQQSKLIKDAVLREARHGNFKPLRQLMIGFPVAGAVASGVRDFVRQRKMKNFFQREGEDYLDSIIRYYATVGGLSILADMYSSAQHAPSALLEFIVGPSLSDASRGAYSLTQVLQKKPKTRAMKGWLARQIPIPVFQQAAIEATKPPGRHTNSPFGDPDESILNSVFNSDNEDDKGVLNESGKQKTLFPK